MASVNGKGGAAENAAPCGVSKPVGNKLYEDPELLCVGNAELEPILAGIAGARDEEVFVGVSRVEGCCEPVAE